MKKVLEERGVKGCRQNVQVGEGGATAEGKKYVSGKKRMKEDLGK